MSVVTRSSGGLLRPGGATGETLRPFPQARQAYFAFSFHDTK